MAIAVALTARASRRTDRACRISLVCLVATTALVVIAAAGGPSILVPESSRAFPAWEAGPLRWCGLHVTNRSVLNIGFSAVLLGTLALYGLLLRGSARLRPRLLIGTVVALHAIVLLGPPLPYTDLFNYLGYARLGGLHHLSPYAHAIAAERGDPVVAFTSWHHLRSPYGELFTALTYPLGLLPLAVAYWTLKTATVSLGLVFLSLVWRCARRLGAEPRRALVFVAFNPAYLFYELGGFHNDVVMLVPAMAAIWLLLSGRDRPAGALLVAAVAVKFTAILLVPFLLTAVGDGRRRLVLLSGAVPALAGLIAVSVALFGPSLPNLGQQSTLLIPTSVPNLVGLPFGIGGSRLVLDCADVALAGVVIGCWRRHRRDWATGAG